MVTRRFRGVRHIYFLLFRAVKNNLWGAVCFLIVFYSLFKSLGGDFTQHQALYRKWRPKTFDDVIGQKHVTDTIRNEIKNNVCGHAFLFCGSRGTGKTSTARILSRAVNCENPIDGNPCNVCATCRGIENGSIMDIIEIDAASNGGVDNIRTLREEAGYTAAVTKYKVYIIDEVHALSNDAFNALLKLLEEPPEHVKFVLATTEANKVLETISSRCQRFDFKRITPEDIYARLDYICNAEGILADEKSLRMIAVAADGSLRDALSLLEPCIASGKELDPEFVADFLGKAENGSVIDLCEQIGLCNAAAAADSISAICRRGKNLTPFIENVIKAVRDLLIISITGKCKSDFEESEYKRLENICPFFSTEKLLYVVKTLSEAVSAARYMTNPRVVYEAAVIKLCIKGNDGSYDALLARIGELERKLESGAYELKTSSPSPERKTEGSAPEEKKLLLKKKRAPLPDGELVKKVKAVWPEVMADISDSIVLYSTLENVSLNEEDGKLALTFPEGGGRELQDMIKDGLARIQQSVCAHTGAQIELITRLDSDLNSEKPSGADPLEDIIKLPITNVE